MYKITYIHKDETTENVLYQPGSREYCLSAGNLNLSAGASGELTISIPQTNPAKDDFVCLTDEVIVYRDDTEIWRGRAMTRQYDFLLTGTLTCEGVLSYLYDTYYPPFEFQSSPSEFLEAVLENHNSQVEDRKKIYLGNVTVEDNNDYINRSSIYYNRTLTVLTEKLINDSLGGYFHIRIEDGKKYLDYLESYGTTATQAVKFGSNLLDIAQNVEYSDLATVILPLGAKLEDDEGNETDEYLTIESVNGGSIYYADEAAVEEYGWIVVSYEWEDVTEASNLLTKAKNYLAQVTSAVASFEVNAVDLSLLSDEYEAFNLGDFILIKSEPHGVNQYVELTEMSIDLLNPENDTYTFGSETASLTDSQKTSDRNVQTALESLQARFTNLVAVTITTDYLNAHYITADEINATYITTDRLKAEMAEFGYVTADEIDALVGNFGYLTASSATITTLNSDIANITAILSGSIGTGNLQSVHITADNVVFDDAVISSAAIVSLAADKITSGTIYTNLVNIANNDGKNLWIDGSTIQINDGTCTRVQIGEDASGDYNMYLWNDGGTLIWDAKGLTEAGLTGNGAIIKDAAVADDAAISGNKLDIQSVASALNDDGSITVDYSRVIVNDTTLDYSLTTITDNTNAAAAEAEAANAAAQAAQETADQAQADATQAAADAAAAQSTADATAIAASTAQSAADTAAQAASDAQSTADTAKANAATAQSAADDAQATADAAAEAAANAQTYAEQAQRDAASSLSEYAESVSATLDGLQSQIDGQIETWYYDYTPALTNLPASDWTTDDEKETHIGDLFFDKSTGYSYRFFNNNGTYEWTLIQDTDITTALATASTAQDTADAKKRVFTTTPTPPYDVGDLWTDGTDIKTCMTARASGATYVSTDWVVLNEYANQDAVDAAQSAADAAQSAADSAQSAADAAVADAATAQSAADAAASDAANAQSTADTAKANAATAQTTANNAATAAATAQETANAAQTAADEAQAAADAVATRTTTLETELSVVQGQISAIVSETDITELQNGNMTLYDLYTSINATVNGLISTVGEVQTTVADNYESLDARITTVSETADGITSTVSALSTTVDNYYTTLSSQITTVSETAEGLAVSVSDVQSVIAENIIVDGTFDGYTTFGTTYSWYRSNSSYITVATYNDKPCICYTRGGSSYYIRQTVNAPAGTYVVKVKIARGADCSPAIRARIGSTYVYLNAEDELTTDWVTYSATITTTSTSTYFYLYCYATYDSTAAASTKAYVTDIVVYEAVELTSALAEIEVLADSISLSVTNAVLGSTASIVLSANGTATSQQTIDLSGVRNAFADDTTAITISAGTVTFDSNTFVVNSTHFNVTAEGLITAKGADLYGDMHLDGSLYMYFNSTHWGNYTESGYYEAIKIDTGSNPSIRFGAFEDNSYIGIGSGMFEVYSKGNCVMYREPLDSSNATLYIYDKLGSAPALYNHGYGVFGETISHKYYLDWASSTVKLIIDATTLTLTYSSSDERLKKNICDIDDALIDAVGNTPLLSYHMDYGLYDGSIEYVGTTAQKLIEQIENNGLSTDDARKILAQSQATTGSDELYWMIDYEQFLILRMAYNEKRIAALEAQIATLMTF